MLTRGYYEAGQEQELVLSPVALQFGAGLAKGQAQVSQAIANIKASGADIPMFTERCGNGNVTACQALMNRARELGEPCPAEAVQALFPTGLECDCDTGACTQLEAMEASALGGVPMWAWIAGAGALYLLLMRGK